MTLSVQKSKGSPSTKRSTQHASSARCVNSCMAGTTTLGDQAKWLQQPLYNLMMKSQMVSALSLWHPIAQGSTSGPSRGISWTWKPEAAVQAWSFMTKMSSPPWKVLLSKAPRTIGRALLATATASNPMHARTPRKLLAGVESSQPA